MVFRQKSETSGAGGASILRGFGADLARLGREASPAALVALLAAQLACAFFVACLLLAAPAGGLLGVAAKVAAVVALGLGGLLGALLLDQRRGKGRAAARGSASAAFVELVESRFAAWELTPAEREVGLFAVKGLNTSEIAALRHTSEGTVKAQMNAIYRKAKVSSRSQLLSLFIDDLLDDASARPGASRSGGR